MLLASLCALLTTVPAATVSGQVVGHAASRHALVLSGGGARGLAHAGSVLALVQLGYDPELVVGTSMGAIIGALLAAGLMPDEIWSIVASENWLERFAAEPVAVGRSRQPLRPTVTLGLNRGRFYEGFVSTTRVNLRLVELLFDAGARARNDFDRLPLRYRAVATDLSTGTEVVLSAGDLPRAVRASMAVPGAFAPVQWNNLVLVDGGIANNLPITVARTLTDAPIIAVDVVRPRPELDERSPLDLGVRAVRLLIENARPDTIEPDILVLTQLSAGFAEGRFPVDASGLLRAGHAAVIEQVPHGPMATPAARRAPGPQPDRIGRIEVESADPAAARLVRRIMAPAVGPYDAEEIALRTAALYGTGLFSAVWPRLVFTDDEHAAATLVVDAVPVARTSVAAALSWDSDVGGRAWASLMQRTSLATPVEMKGGLVLSELGHDASIEASIFSSMLPGLIWNAGGHASDERIRHFEGSSIHDTTHVRRAGGWAGAELHGPIRNTFVSLLARADHVRGDITSAHDSVAGWSYGPYLRLSPPPQPDRVVGIEPILEWEARTGDLPYTRWNVRAGVSRGIGRVRAAGALHVHAATRTAPADALPATQRDLAPWLPTGALRSRLVAGAGIDVAYPTLLDGFLRVRLRAIGTDSAVTRNDRGWSAIRQTRWLAGGEIGAIWPTVIGPLSVGVAAGEQARWSLNLAIGAAF